MIEVKVYRESVCAGDDSRYGARLLSVYENDFLKRVISKSCEIDDGEYGSIFENYGEAWTLYVGDRYLAKFTVSNGKLNVVEQKYSTLKQLKITNQTEFHFRLAAT
jgi:hypothetical protein